MLPEYAALSGDKQYKGAFKKGRAFDAVGTWLFV